MEAAKRPEIQQKKYKRQGHQHGLGHETQDKEQKNRQISANPGAFGIPYVTPHCEHPEKGAKYILAFCHPRNRLYMKRMQREQGSNKAALP